MNVESHVFDCPPRNNTTPALKMAAKRYTKGSSHEEVQGLTLIFAHCIGAHKEQWEPIISLLFDLQCPKSSAHRVREAWAFDWQNHGDSAVLNRDALKRRPEGISALEWSAALGALVNSPRMKGHRIVPLGHSAGAGAILLTTKSMPQPYQYPALILIEPTLITHTLFHLPGPGNYEDRIAAMDFAVTATAARRDTWRSRDAAREYFRKRVPWEGWDEQVLGIYVDYGLEDSPSGDGVTLKCNRTQESIAYRDVDPPFEGALHLGRVCRSMPIHLIWGTRNDLVPEFIQNSLSDPSEGRVVASITKVEDAGHMVVQEKPDLLARAIADILDGIGISSTGGNDGASRSRSRL